MELKVKQSFSRREVKKLYVHIMKLLSELLKKEA